MTSQLRPRTPGLFRVEEWSASTRKRPNVSFSRLHASVFQPVNPTVLIYIWPSSACWVSCSNRCGLQEAKDLPSEHTFPKESQSPFGFFKTFSEHFRCISVNLLPFHDHVENEQDFCFFTMGVVYSYVKHSCFCFISLFKKSSECPRANWPPSADILNLSHRKDTSSLYSGQLSRAHIPSWRSFVGWRPVEYRCRRRKHRWPYLWRKFQRQSIENDLVCSSLL